MLGSVMPGVSGGLSFQLGLLTQLSESNGGEGGQNSSPLFTFDFGKVDTDASGDVTLADVTASDAFGPNAEALFDSMDVDSDGLVTAAEHTDFMTRLQEQLRDFAKEAEEAGTVGAVTGLGVAPTTGASDAAADAASAEAESVEEADNDAAAAKEAFLKASEDEKTSPPIRDDDEDDDDSDTQTESPEALRRREAILEQEAMRLTMQAEATYLGLQQFDPTGEKTLDLAA